MKRRISAILAADMAGYSRLIELDEAGILARQKKHMIELIRPCIESHDGSIVKLTGDGLIAEFASVIQAVQCAVHVQREMPGREESQPKDMRIRYRTAVNLGDVVFEDGDVYGDGVNIAARLEELAEPGGIVVSGTAYDMLKNNVDVAYVPLGEKRLKNISTPVRVYQVQVDGNFAPPGKRRFKHPTVVVLGLALLGAILWNASDQISGTFEAKSQGKPSLAVMPFDNLSGEPDQIWFANGLSEDLTTYLSRRPSLFVIARNSAFATAEVTSNPVEAARSLKVAYVIEGSVRKVNDSLRLNVQLVDGETGENVWAERYDGTSEDVLNFVEDISAEVLGALNASDPGSGTPPHSGETTNPKAFDAYLEGLGRYRLETPDGVKDAISNFERAVELDPQYGRAYAAMASAYLLAYEKGWYEEFGYNVMERRFLRAKAEENLELAEDYPTGMSHFVAAGLHRMNARRDDMLKQIRAAVEKEPGNALYKARLALALTLDGRPESALEAINSAMKIDPLHSARFQLIKGIILFDLKRYEDAIEMLDRAYERNSSDASPLYWIAAAQALSGNIDAAKETHKNHKFRRSFDSLKLYLPYRLPEQLDHLEEGMRLAGYRRIQ